VSPIQFPGGATPSLEVSRRLITKNSDNYSAASVVLEFCTNGRVEAGGSNLTPTRLVQSSTYRLLD
jgi:hypothetical protein